MKPREPRLLVEAPPFLRQRLTTPRAMLDVVIALLPVVLAGAWYFGLAALLVVAAASAGAVLTEATFAPAGRHRETLRDGTGVLTGLLLGLTLPPALPLWMAFLGGVAAIGLGKLVWGGLGSNLFNPALVGRAFLQAAFPTALTTWTMQSGPQGFLSLPETTLAAPFMHPATDAISAATPLGLLKFQHQGTPLADLVLGNVAGSIGETSAVLILLGGLYLLVRDAFDWRIPAGVLAAVAACSAALLVFDPARFPDPLTSLGSGGLLFGAIYMATDPVTSPVTPRGAWIYGLGIGALVVLIRGFGGLPEGVMYAILLMNACTPLIERYTQPRVFGRGRPEP